MTGNVSFRSASYKSLLYILQKERNQLVTGGFSLSPKTICFNIRIWQYKEFLRVAPGARARFDGRFNRFKYLIFDIVAFLSMHCVVIMITDFFNNRSGQVSFASVFRPKINARYFYNNAPTQPTAWNSIPLRVSENYSPCVKIVC